MSKLAQGIEASVMKKAGLNNYISLKQVLLILVL